MLEATARDVLGDPAAAGHAVERALELAEPDSTPSAFLLYPMPGGRARPRSRPARSIRPHDLRLALGPARRVTAADCPGGPSRRLWRHRQQMLASADGCHVSWT
jgi:hypothetical protein